MLAHTFLIKSSSKLLVTRTGIKAQTSLNSGLWFPWPIYMFFEMRGCPWHIGLRWAIVALRATCFNFNAFTKFYQNQSIGSQDIEHKRNFNINQARAITLLKLIKKYCSIIQIYILSISMQIQNLIEIHKLIHKILSTNEILTSIKGHNSVKNWPKIRCIRYNIDLVFINAYIFFFLNSSICSEDIEEKHIFYIIKGHNSVVYKQIWHICNPKPLLPDQYPCNVWRKSVKY